VIRVKRQINSWWGERADRELPHAHICREWGSSIGIFVCGPAGDSLASSAVDERRAKEAATAGGGGRTAGRGGAGAELRNALGHSICFGRFRWEEGWSLRDSL